MKKSIFLFVLGMIFLLSLQVFGETEGRYKVAYVSDQGKHKDIFIMNPDGSGKKRLIKSPEDDFNPIWSFDGKRIAYISAHLYEEKKGVQSVNVIYPGRDDDKSCVFWNEFKSIPNLTQFWSPDGRYILLSHEGEIITANADFAGDHGSSFLISTYKMGFSGAKNTQPDWSPDGKQIVFVSDYDSYEELYVANLDGSNPKRIVKADGTCGGPRWSPDGRYIAYYFIPDDETQPEGLFLLDLNTKSSSGTVGVWTYAWSPDGKYLAGFRLIAEKNDTMTLIGYKFDIGAKKFTQLTGPFTESSSTSDDELNMPWPSWSPDGQKIAYVTDNGLFIVNADGSLGLEPIRAVKGSISVSDYQFVSDYQWSPDGKKIFVTISTDVVSHHIYALDVNTLKLKQLTSGKDEYAPACSPLEK